MLQAETLSCDQNRSPAQTKGTIFNYKNIQDFRVICRLKIGKKEIPSIFINILYSLLFLTSVLKILHSYLTVLLPIGVYQGSCPPISCDVSDFRDAGFAIRVEPDGSGGLPVAGLA